MFLYRTHMCRASTNNTQGHQWGSAKVLGQKQERSYGCSSRALSLRNPIGCCWCPARKGVPHLGLGICVHRCSSARSCFREVTLHVGRLLRVRFSPPLEHHFQRTLTPHCGAGCARAPRGTTVQPYKILVCKKRHILPLEISGSTYDILSP